MITGQRWQRGRGIRGSASWATCPGGTHFCHFYETTEDLLDTLVPYFKAGLEGNEFCVWVISEPLREADAWSALEGAVPELGRYVSRQSIELFEGRLGARSR